MSFHCRASPAFSHGEDRPNGNRPMARSHPPARRRLGAEEWCLKGKATCGKLVPTSGVASMRQVAPQGPSPPARAVTAWGRRMAIKGKASGGKLVSTSGEGSMRQAAPQGPPPFAWGGAGPGRRRRREAFRVAGVAGGR
jgi:hypothetical protein